MGRRYQHLSSEERAMIALEGQRGTSMRDMARQIGRSVATISREYARNGASTSRRYDPSAAACAYRRRRWMCGRRPKLVEGDWLHGYVHDQLGYRQWSPEQIAARLRSMFPDDANRQVSHETVYAAIYAYPVGH